ncbi:hypothetical protein ABZP36_034297 [Zizania latifolia]
MDATSLLALPWKLTWRANGSNFRKRHNVSPLPCAAEQRDIARDTDREAECVMSQKAEQGQALRLSLPHATALAVAHSSCFFLLSYPL